MIARLTVLLLIFAATTSMLPVFAEANTVGANTCTTIDTNWKEYGRQIHGANKKVSDVVLNACAAIGGGCTFNSGSRTPEQNATIGGAENSQHLQGNAIDLNVPAGKEVEFMTLAICGLRRVNNCQGGLGYYRSKAIHVDVRTNTNAVWSNGFRRVNIASNVSDPNARGLLYGFGDGKCTDGSIQGDYSDEKIYGPPVKYEPPAGIPATIIRYPTTDPTTVYASLIGQQIGYGLTQMFQSNSSGQSTLGASDIVYRDADNTDGTGLLPPAGDLLGDDSARTQDLLNSFLSQPQKDAEEKGSVGIDNPTEECAEDFSGSGVLGNCGTPSKTPEDGVVTTIERVETETKGGIIGNVLSRVFGGTDFTFDTDGSVQRVRTSGGGVDVFYGVHTPQDENANQAVQFGNGLPGYSQFNVGETQSVVRETPQIVTESIRFVELSTTLGAYYGLMHGVSPLVVGSAPRTLARLWTGIQSGTITTQRPLSETDAQKVVVLVGEAFWQEVQSPITLASETIIIPDIPAGATYEEGVEILKEVARTNSENEYVYAYVIKNGVGTWVYLGAIGAQGGFFDNRAAYTSNPDQVVLVHTHPSVSLEQHPPSLTDIMAAVNDGVTRYGAVDRNGVWEYKVIFGGLLDQLRQDLASIAKKHPDGARVLAEQQRAYLANNPNENPAVVGQVVLSEALSGAYGTPAQQIAQELMRLMQQSELNTRYENAIRKLESIDPIVSKQGVQEMLELYEEYGIEIIAPEISTAL